MFHAIFCYSSLGPVGVLSPFTLLSGLFAFQQSLLLSKASRTVGTHRFLGREVCFNSSGYLRTIRYQQQTRILGLSSEKKLLCSPKGTALV